MLETFSGHRGPACWSVARYSENWADSMPTFSPTWRRSTSAGEPNWPGTRFGSTPAAWFFTSEEEPFRTTIRRRSTSTSATISACCSRICPHAPFGPYCSHAWSWTVQQLLFSCFKANPHSSKKFYGPTSIFTNNGNHSIKKDESSSNNVSLDPTEFSAAVSFCVTRSVEINSAT